jgi:SNF2 family DNA or RNA helicase
MPRTRMDVRVGLAGNGTPVFLSQGSHPSLGRIFGATWDEGRSLWVYPAFFPAVDLVLSDFKIVGETIDVVMSDAAVKHVDTAKKVRGRLLSRVLPEGFQFATDPYDHQIDGLCHVFYNHRAALFYEQGLGKCKIAIDLIRLLKHTGAAHRALVLGPRVTVQNWGREIDLHSGKQLSWRAIDGTVKQKTRTLEEAAASSTDVTLATYDTARSLVDTLVSSLPYAVLICDESHSIKSWNSQRTHATYEVAQKASRRVLLTGSPTDGNPLHVYGPYKVLGDCFMPEPYHVYKRRHLVTPNPNSHVVLGYKNLDVVNKRTTLLSSRRTKAECLDLPTRTVVETQYALCAAQVAAYNQVVEGLGIDPTSIEGLSEAIASGAPWNRPPPLPVALSHMAVGLIKLQQITSGFLVVNEVNEQFEQVDRLMEFSANPKLDALEELLDGILDDETHKCIVWCVHTHEMNLVCARLTASNMKHVRMDGTTKNPQEVVDEFNDDPSVRVYVGMVSMGVGVTLNAASYVIYHSLPYSLTQYTQSLDRNYRIGQDKRVTVYRLMGLGTLEKVVAYLLDHKIEVDKLLTTKVECAVCPHAVRCAEKKIEPFDEGCIHPRRTKRPVIKATKIEEEP